MLNELYYKRFMQNVREDTNGCWVWQKGLSRGYPIFHVECKSYRAHRLIYRHYFGEVSPDLHVHHTCENKACVNPYHLSAVTPMENNMASDTGCRRNSLKTHCPKGHPYDEENTYHYNGRRHCRKCLGMFPKGLSHKPKTHCKRGHELSGDNISIRQGRRHCKLCSKLRYEANKLEV